MQSSLLQHGLEVAPNVCRADTWGLHCVGRCLPWRHKQTCRSPRFQGFFQLPQTTSDIWRHSVHYFVTNCCEQTPCKGLAQTWLNRCAEEMSSCSFGTCAWNCSKTANSPLDVCLFSCKAKSRLRIFLQIPTCRPEIDLSYKPPRDLSYITGDDVERRRCVKKGCY